MALKLTLVFSFLNLIGLASLFLLAKTFFSYQKKILDQIVRILTNTSNDHTLRLVRIEDKAKLLFEKIGNKDVKVKLVSYKSKNIK